MPPLRTACELDTLGDLSQRLLAVFPHPDDEAYGCAGALLRAESAALLCLTRGEAAQMGPERGLSREELGRVRAGRLDEVARILDLDGLLLPGLPDGRLARCDIDEVAAPIIEALDAYRPHVVIGHDPRGVNGHPDHIASHWALRHALRGRPGIRFAMIVYTKEVCDLVLPRLLFPTAPGEIDVTLHLTEAEITAKEASLRVHEALVTLIEGSGAGLLVRPPVEHYDLLGEDCEPALSDVFAGLG